MHRRDEVLPAGEHGRRRGGLADLHDRPQRYQSSAVLPANPPATPSACPATPSRLVPRPVSSESLGCVHIHVYTTCARPLATPAQSKMLFDWILPPRLTPRLTCLHLPTQPATSPLRGTPASADGMPRWTSHQWLAKTWCGIAGVFSCGRVSCSMTILYLDILLHQLFYLSDLNTFRPLPQKPSRIVQPEVPTPHPPTVAYLPANRIYLSAAERRCATYSDNY